MVGHHAVAAHHPAPRRREPAVVRSGGERPLIFRSQRAARIPIGSYGPALLRRTVQLPLDQLKTHIHVIGTSGSGKSRFLAGLILALIERGQALTLIDPHGDLARLVLAQLVARGYFRDERAFDRLLYLDLPAAERQNLFLPFNVLRQPLPPHSLAANIKEAFHRAWPALSGGAAPMFDTLVQDGVKVLISNDRPLTGLYRLLTDKPFRDGLLLKETDPDVVRFFREQFDRLSPRDQAQQAGSALRRAHLLTFSPVLRHSLGQNENRLDFRRIIDRNQTVIINLALADAETRRLLGCLLTVSAEQGALSRMQLPPAERTNTYHLICDEWIEFAAQSEEALSRMLSLTRKVGLFAVLAHQTWTQTSLRMRGALQNVGLEVAFRLGRPDAEYAASILGRINPAAVKHRVADPAAAARGHPLFEPLSEQWERWVQAIQDLAPRQAFLRHSDGTLIKLRTMPVPNPRVKDDQVTAIEKAYLTRYFRSVDQIAQQPVEAARHRSTQAGRRRYTVTDPGTGQR